MIGYNHITLLGNLTRDPELKYLASGSAVCSFPLAVNRTYKQGDEKKEETTYIDIVVFGRQGEHCGQYLHKGEGCIVDGRLQQRRWETEDGQKRSKHEVVAQSVTFLPKKGKGEAPESYDDYDPTERAA